MTCFSPLLYRPVGLFQRRLESVGGEFSLPDFFSPSFCGFSAFFLPSNCGFPARTPIFLVRDKTDYFNIFVNFINCTIVQFQVVIQIFNLELSWVHPVLALRGGPLGVGPKKFRTGLRAVEPLVDPRGTCTCLLGTVYLLLYCK